MEMNAHDNNNGEGLEKFNVIVRLGFLKDSGIYKMWIAV